MNHHDILHQWKASSSGLLHFFPSTMSGTAGQQVVRDNIFSGDVPALLSKHISGTIWHSWLPEKITWVDTITGTFTKKPNKCRFNPDFNQALLFRLSSPLLLLSVWLSSLLTLLSLSPLCTSIVTRYQTLRLLLLSSSSTTTSSLSSSLLLFWWKMFKQLQLIPTSADFHTTPKTSKTSFATVALAWFFKIWVAPLHDNTKLVTSPSPKSPDHNVSFR